MAARRLHRQKSIICSAIEVTHDSLLLPDPLAPQNACVRPDSMVSVISCRAGRSGR